LTDVGPKPDPPVGLYRTGAPGTPVGNIALPGEPTEIASELALTYESGVEILARSQWWYIRNRFLRHRLAVAGLVLLVIIFGAGALAGIIPYVPPYGSNQQNPLLIGNPLGPTLTGHHIFGTDFLGRDYFSRIVYGIRTSEEVALLVALVSTFIGVAVGAVAGYYGGWVDNVLMRITDLFLTLPIFAVLLTVAAFVKTKSIVVIALILALLFWTFIARIIRGVFLSLREKEYVEAARAAGSGDLRIMFRHMLPNTLGPIIVNATITVANAILTEAALSFLGFGIQPPKAALGLLIAQGKDQPQPQEWWLVIFPGLMILLIVLCVNFVGDGLRDAFDPQQRRTRA
jgi:ABC-type dipeptide/oligopeptide/nickel transport system permease subunit